MINTAILVLAAGASNRMGEPKQLLPFCNKNLLAVVLEETLLVNPNDVFLVLGANYSLIHEKIKSYPLTVLNHLNWEQGIGSSIAYGVSEIQKLNVYDRVVVVLADQPSIQSSEIKSLIHFHLKNKSLITITACKNYKGVPAVFEKELFLELMSLSGDNGAKSIIKKHQNLVWEFDIGKEILDIDTIKDYQKIVKRFGSN